MEAKLPIRKHPRLSSYDYSSAGAYFVTICIQGRRCVLSRVVGRGLAPAEKNGNSDISTESAQRPTPQIEFTTYGKIAERQLLSLKMRYAHVTIDRYVIMPNHIHAILVLDRQTAGASPRPTIMDIICAYKSMVTRECKTVGFSGKMFQTSFYEHIIRGKEDYNEIAKYIYENPVCWYYDELYSEC